MKTGPLRCAIYTRVSTEHGLDQDFNSLDNQREAAEAYIKSQAHEGWRPAPGRFDDGGFSGGSLERPALKELLRLVTSRRIDVVVVYKVDRLTRSLADFAKLVEVFDAHGVSFVSVTQAFNTTSSMGRLTLNVLLSFAQFEREVTGERIRDKIAASKQKGIWMGGVVPLGYRVESRALHIVEEHAVLIRMIFTQYQELGSVMKLHRQLSDTGVVAPERTDGAGRMSGGKPFSRGHLYRILANPIYAGRLGHKGKVHEGQQPAIIAPSSFDAVQARLATNDHGKRQTGAVSAHLLAGRICTADGKLMTPSHASRGQTRYRYYLARSVLDGSPAASSVRRIAAPAIEAVVLAGLRRATRAGAGMSDVDLIGAHLKQVTVHADRLDVELAGEEEEITLAWSPASARRRRDIIVPPGQAGDRLRPMKVEDRARILRAIAKARGWMRDLIEGRIDGSGTLAMRETVTERSVRMTLSLAQLAPGIVKAIVEGRLPRGIGVCDLVELPASWTEQERMLGIV